MGNEESIPESHKQIFKAVNGLRARLEAVGVHSIVAPSRERDSSAESWPNAFSLATYKGEIPAEGVTDEEKPVANLWAMQIKPVSFATRLGHVFSEMSLASFETPDLQLQVTGYSNVPHYHGNFRFQSPAETDTLLNVIVKTVDKTQEALAARKQHDERVNRQFSAFFPAG